jgi:transposase
MSKTISKTLRYKILERDGFKCQACGATNCLEIDHIIPRSKGGLTEEFNLQTLCADCNRGKGDSMPESINRLVMNYKQAHLDSSEIVNATGMTLEEWAKKHGLAKSTAYKMLKIANVTPESCRLSHSRSPVSYLTLEHQQKLAEVVRKYKMGITLTSMLEECCNKYSQTVKSSNDTSSYKKNTRQFNIRIDAELDAQFRSLAHARGMMLGLDQNQSVNRALRQALEWYIENCPE